VKPLPASLKDSIKMLEESTTFDAMLGKSLKENYVAAKKVDESIMSTWSEDHRRKLVTMLF
jgi:glutamine synthetase